MRYMSLLVAYVQRFFLQWLAGRSFVFTLPLAAKRAL